MITTEVKPEHQIQVVRLNEIDIDKVSYLIRKVVPHNETMRIFYLSLGGKWIEVAKNEVHPKECKIPFETIDIEIMSHL